MTQNRKNKPVIKDIRTLQRKPPVNKQDKHAQKRWLVFLFMVLLVIITFFTYRSSLDNGFTDWDDPDYVLENNHVKQLNWETVRYFFSNPSASNYHPLTMISLSMDYYFTTRGEELPDNTKDPDARIFHITSLSFHLLNVLLVFLFIYLLSRGRIWIAVLTALFFGIHPMHVESVAWISERKDVLYTFFFLAGLILYLKYLENKSWIFYFLTLIMFLLSLLSKPAAVVFPLILLSVDFFRGRKFDLRAILEKIPFLLLAIVFGLITFYIQSKIAISDFKTFTVFQRFLFASYGCIMYIYKLFVPLKLSAFYPYPSLLGSGHLPVLFYMAPLLLAVVIGAIIYSLKYTKAIMFAFCFYFFTIALVLQFISVGSAIMADRYSYLPSVGIFFLLGFLLDYIITKKEKIYWVFAYLFAAVMILFSVFFIMLTHKQIQVWHDPLTLWTDVISKYTNVETAYKNRGNYYGKMNLTDLALKDYMVLIQLQTKDALVYSNLGNIYGLRGEIDKSLEAYSKSIQLDSTKVEPFLNRGITYALSKNFTSAIKDFTKAISLNPESPTIYENRAFAFLEMGELDKSIADYDLLIKSYPQRYDYYLKRGLCKYRQNNFKEALDDFKQCLGINPDNADAWFNSSVVYNILKDNQNALTYALKAKSLGYAVDQAYLDKLVKPVK